MHLEEILNLINTTLPSQIELTKIPNINLYMDQVLTFMNDNLDYLKRNPKDKTITKSMINNYVKNNILPKPENKKYFPHHVIALIYIFNLKQILSLEDINTATEFYLKEHFNYKDISELYSIFLKIESGENKRLKKEITSLSESIYSNELCKNLEEDEKLFLLIMLLNSCANNYKLIIENLLDNIINI